MCRETKDLKRSQSLLSESEDGATGLMERGEALPTILFLVNDGQVGLAKFFCNIFARHMSIDEKAEIVDAFLKAGDLHFARDFRYSNCLGAHLPKNHPVIKATSTRFGDRNNDQ